MFEPLRFEYEDYGKTPPCVLQSIDPKPVEELGNTRENGARAGNGRDVTKTASGARRGKKLYAARMKRRSNPFNRGSGPAAVAVSSPLLFRSIFFFSHSV